MMGEGGETPLTIEEARLLAEDLRHLLHERDLLSLQAARIAGLLAVVDYGDAAGSVSTVDWIRHEYHLGYMSAADLVATGLVLDSLPAAVAAVEEGDIGFQHLVHLARTQRAVGDKLLELDRLLAEAKQVSAGRFWHVCQEARHAADAQGVAEEQAALVEERALKVNRREDGTVTLSGVLDPVGGAALRSALEPLARKTDREDTRRRERRLADALVELAQHSMDQGSPRQRPHVNVTATIGTLLQVPGSPSANIDHGHTVSAVTVGRIACDCSITRHIFDSQGQLVELGRTKRVVSTPLRRALERRDGHCAWPGCSRDATWCEAHHVIAWTRGGETNLDNLVLLCTRHHWQVHEGKWQLFLQPDGRVEVLRPPLEFAPAARAPAELAAA